jgi:phage terminase Nu1 subunit (DNA packaging protein)
MEYDFTKIECTAGEMAGLLGITDRRLRQLAKAEIIPQRKRGGFNLQEVTQAYIAFCKRGTSLDKETGVDFNKEKALLTKAQREKAELEVAVIKGELHRGDDVKVIIGDMIMAFRAKILAIPTKLAPRLLAQTEINYIQDIIKRAHHEALNELSEYSPAAFHSRNKNVIVGKIDNG